MERGQLMVNKFIDEGVDFFLIDFQTIQEGQTLIYNEDSVGWTEHVGHFVGWPGQTISKGVHWFYLYGWKYYSFIIWLLFMCQTQTSHIYY